MNKYRLLAMDVDGTLTDGKIYMTEKGEAFKAFDVKDGYGIKHILKELNMKSAIMTARKSAVAKKRAEDLDIDFIYEDVKDKKSCLETLLTEEDYVREEIIYIGDDVNDIECIKMAGLGCCPADAHKSVRTAADYVTSHKAGAGAVREVIDMVAEGKVPVRREDEII